MNDALDRTWVSSFAHNAARNVWAQVTCVVLQADCDHMLEELCADSTLDRLRCYRGSANRKLDRWYGQVGNMAGPMKNFLDRYQEEWLEAFSPGATRERPISPRQERFRDSPTDTPFHLSVSEVGPAPREVFGMDAILPRDDDLDLSDVELWPEPEFGDRSVYSGDEGAQP